MKYLCLKLRKLSQNYNFNSNISASKTKILNTKLKYWLDDFFMGVGKDSFSYSSSVMSRSSKILRTNSTNFF